MNSGTCRGCGRPIIWIRTAAGRSMPCDPELITYWQTPGGSKKVVTPNGVVISAELEGDQDAATGIGYRNHFATCPVSGEFRRR